MTARTERPTPHGLFGTGPEGQQGILTQARR
ncbi:MAG: hypothetical protein QOE51_1943 [Actinoplanes sp.]|jgi:hypothetical protein|nr:hypothetical protein [Actinoplanes sp.]